MTKKLMIDSGAFSVWNKGTHINLASYIAFCKRYNEASYFVSLDVIPGEPSNRRSLTKQNIEDACACGWSNYQEMIKCLPMNKIIPVFHMGDDTRWLGKYLDFGVEYIGISPANDRSSRDKRKWLRSIQRMLFDGAGRAVVKTHGFAVTDTNILNFWDWHSADSTSWQINAANGMIFLPRTTGGRDDYSKPPLTIGLSLLSPKVNKSQSHLANLSPYLLERLESYLKGMGINKGEGCMVKVPQGYRLKGYEQWANKNKTEILRPISFGVATRVIDRLYVNARYMRRMNKVCSVNHIYLAGMAGTLFSRGSNLEWRLGYRLLSFALLQSNGIVSDSVDKRMKRHFRSMRKCNNRSMTK